MITKTHLKRFQEVLKASEVDAALVTSEANQTWVSDFDFSDGYVLVTKEKAYVITDFRYIEAARAELSSDFEVSMPKYMLGEISEILKNINATTVMFEEQTLSVAALARIEEKIPGVKFVSGASKAIDGLREYKDAKEIELMGKAQDIADAAFAHVLKVMTPEMTEIEVALELEFFMRKNGASGPSFSTIAVSGSASSLPHGVPRNIKLQKGFFTMDFGAVYKGYCSDMTRTIVLGKADAEMKKLYDTVLRAQLAGVENARPGMSCRGLDKIARDIIDGEGYEGCFGHSLGHGVGRYIHEDPRVSFGAPEGKLLEPGHVITCEPGIYIAGKYGCRIEDMLAITEDGCLNFAHSPKELIELF